VSCPTIAPQSDSQRLVVEQALPGLPRLAKLSISVVRIRSSGHARVEGRREGRKMPTLECPVHRKAIPQESVSPRPEDAAMVSQSEPNMTLVADASTSKTGAGHADPRGWDRGRIGDDIARASPILIQCVYRGM
jgi:hypothetical protein